MLLALSPLLSDVDDCASAGAPIRVNVSAAQISLAFIKVSWPVAPAKMTAVPVAGLRRIPRNLSRRRMSMAL